MRSSTRYRLDELSRDPVMVSLVLSSIVLLNVAFWSTGVFEASALSLSLKYKYQLFWSALLSVTELIPPFVAMYLGLKALGPSLATGQYYIELAHAKRKESVYDSYLKVVWAIALFYVVVISLNSLALHLVSKLPVDSSDFLAWCLSTLFSFGVYCAVGFLASVLFYGWSGLILCLGFFIMVNIVQSSNIPFVNITVSLPHAVREVGMFLFPSFWPSIEALRDETRAPSWIPFIFRMGVPVQVYQAVWIGGITLLARRIAGKKDY